MKRISNSQPLAVATQFRPLSTSIFIEVLGGLSTVQFYRQTVQEWVPDHSIAPVLNDDGAQIDGVLRLKANYSIIDPDGLVDVESLKPQVFWFVNGSQITTTDESSDYYIANDILYVRKNFTHQTGATVYCECRFTDTRTASPLVLSDTLLLSAVLQANEQWSLSLLCDKTRKHFPINAATTLYQFEADVKLGSYSKNSEVAWFWDYSVDNGVTWKEIDENCLWYVSGLSSSILTIDMDLIDDITVRVRIATSTTATAPDLPNIATASCVWRYPILQPVVFSYGGNKVFVETTDMTFSVICHVAKHNDMTEAQKREWLMFNWCIRTQGLTSGLTLLKEYDLECVVPGTRLFSKSSQKFIVDPQLSLRGVYDAMADHDGNIIQTSAGDIITYRT